MLRFWVVICFCAGMTAASAQEDTYIQIEAKPTIAEGIAAAEGYAARIDGISGFQLGRSWYAIAIGPFSSDDARAELQRLRTGGLVPRDSYLAARGDYGAPFFPTGDSIPSAPVALPPMSEVPQTTDLPPIETLADARRAEQALTRDDKASLQTALADAGYYSGAIDASFGQGTRRSMAAWQTANGYDPTGVLTTAQREALLGEYNAVLNDLGMAPVRDQAAGIEIVLPAGIVARGAEESPFVFYDPTGDIPARVVLISQSGNARALAGLYNSMQGLSFVPPLGPRALQANTFEIEGRSGTAISTTFAEHRNGQIKGFTLIWPAGDERRRARVLAAMHTSFTPIPGVLPGPGDVPAVIDHLHEGLSARAPDRNRSGFFVDGVGAVLTTSEAVRSCERITLGASVEADILAEDETLGLALLKPRSSLTPRHYARFSRDLPASRSEIAVAGYPFGGALAAPALNFGRVVEGQTLNGNETLAKLSLLSEPEEAGGPVLNTGGGVVGILVPHKDDDRRFPGGVSFSAVPASITGFLQSAGLTPEVTDTGTDLAPGALTRLASDMTVLVRCWN